MLISVTDIWLFTGRHVIFTREIVNRCIFNIQRALVVLKKKGKEGINPVVVEPPFPS